jgi:uncharacterized protein CbrC (UPF0167 family)
MEKEEITEKEKQMAEKCVTCTICSQARKNQKGFSYGAVKILRTVCPYCKAYEKVYGKKAYEP